MSRRRDDEGIYSEAEARICLTCESKRCLGECERLKQEKKRLYKESRPSPLYEIDEEFSVPEEPPWPKKNPYIHKED
jgi:hypothetical protein